MTDPGKSITTTIIEGLIGFQLGGEVFSEIIFFRDKRAYDEITSGNFEFSATAQAVVIRAGPKTAEFRQKQTTSKAWLPSSIAKAASCMKHRLADRSSPSSRYNYCSQKK
jgi:hypothetical protein